MGNRLLRIELSRRSVGTASGDSIGKFQADQLPLEFFNLRGQMSQKYWAVSLLPGEILAGFRAIFLPRLSKKVESVVLSPS